MAMSVSRLSVQAEERQDRQDDDDQADEIDQTVHKCLRVKIRSPLQL
jgi:hypothetical protein